jgi:uncharacterized protein YndB with AHSA1/START domain
MTDTYTVVRTATIRAPAETVYSHIVDFRRWRAWSPWDDLDPNMQRIYAGADSGVGATYAWSGNRRAGEGRMEIVEATEPSQVVIALEFLKPFKSSSTTTFDLTPADDGTEVAWTMSGPKTLMTKIIGVFRSMDKMVGPDFEKGLGRLTTASEHSER